MKGRFWLNIALLAVVVILGLVAYLKPGGGDSDYRLSTLKPAEANRVEVSIGGAAPIRLERTGADWRLTAPFVARADSFNVQRLLGILEATSRESLPAEGLARFGLSEPSARVIINGQAFAFGAANEVSREQYILTEGKVYLVPLRYATTLPRSAFQIVSKQLFGPDESPVAFEFPDFKVVQVDGKWQLTPGGDLSADDITRWVDEWRLASALNLQPFVRRKPVVTLVVRLKDGRSVVVAVLERESALTLARSDQPYEYQFPITTAKRLLSRPSPAAETGSGK